MITDLFKGMVYNMDNYIIKEKVVVLNETVEGSGVKVFKTWDNRLDKFIVLIKFFY